MTECLTTFWKFYDVIWPLCSNTHADPRSNGQWSKSCREATHEKDVLKTWNNFSPNLSSIKDRHVGYKKSRSNYFRKKYYKNKNKISSQCLSFQFRPTINACTKIIKENINGRAIFVIVAVERLASFYRIFDQENVPASDIS